HRARGRAGGGRRRPGRRPATAGQLAAPFRPAAGARGARAAARPAPVPDHWPGSRRCGGGPRPEPAPARRGPPGPRPRPPPPPPPRPPPPLPAGTSLGINGLSPFVTPNAAFYRVDTAIILPEVDPANWQLRIHGMVDREITLSFADLLRMPLIEHYITLCCVSNPVAGPYIGNAKWLGASLASLLRSAGIRAGANQLLCTSVDGFTSGTPVQVVMDGRDALVAVAMNGTPLPVAHGFPARLVVPGLYGYVSACKWVTDINVTTFADAQAYWVPRGWSQQAPVKTE